MISFRQFSDRFQTEVLKIWLVGSIRKEILENKSVGEVGVRLNVNEEKGIIDGYDELLRAGSYEMKVRAWCLLFFSWLKQKEELKNCFIYGRLIRDN